MSDLAYPSKTVRERARCYFLWHKAVTEPRTIVSAEVTVTQGDAEIGPATVEGTDVWYVVSGGSRGKINKIACLVTLDDDQQLEAVATIMVE